MSGWTGVDSVVLYLLYAAGVQWVIGHRKRGQRPAAAQRVGTLGRITVYPFKGGVGMDVESAECSYNGVVWNGIRDRQWAVIDRQHRLMSSSARYKLASISTSIDDDVMCLNAPDMPTLRLPTTMPPDSPQVKCTIAHMKSSVVAYDCGDEAASWVDRVLKDGTGHRLVYHCPELGQRQVEHARNPALRVQEPTDKDKVGFQSERPFLLGTDVSLRDLNSRLSEPLTMDRFRPNLHINSDCPPFDEDNWREIFIGSAKFSTFQLCDRCPVTTIVPGEGVRDERGEPLTTLRKYRKLTTSGPCFCICLLADTPGHVNVGDEVYVIKRAAQSTF